MLATLLALTSQSENLVVLVGVLACIGLVVYAALGRVPWAAALVASVVILLILLVVTGALG